MWGPSDFPRIFICERFIQRLNLHIFAGNLHIFFAENLHMFAGNLHIFADNLHIFAEHLHIFAENLHIFAGESSTFSRWQLHGLAIKRLLIEVQGDLPLLRATAAGHGSAVGGLCGSEVLGDLDRFQKPTIVVSILLIMVNINGYYMVNDG